MKSKEIFKLYNLKDLKRNKFSMIFISLSILIAITVSLIIPQIKMDKQKYINNITEKSSSADLMVVQSFASNKFSEEMKEYENDGLTINYITSTPVYLNSGENKIMIYLLSGYEDMLDNEVIISKNLAENNNININDEIQLTGLQNEDKLAVSEIESQPFDVSDDAQITGYIKVKNVKAEFNSDNGLVFIFGQDGELLKERLKKVEDGFSYYTIQDRQESLFSELDNQIAALNLISAVGLLLSIAVLVSGIIMLIVKNRKEIANLMLIPLKMKDIKRAMKWEIDIVIFVPLFLAVLISVPLAKLFLSIEGIENSITYDSIINIIKFAVFNFIIFIFYRNIALNYMTDLDPIEIVKGGNGLPSNNIKRIFLIIISLPIALLVYAILLGSETSILSNLLLFVVLVIIFIGISFLIELLVRIPIWKHWKGALYAFNNIKKNKLIFVLNILNLTMLLWFILIGFNLGDTLKNSADINYAKEVPYNYMIRTEDSNKLVDTLKTSAYVETFSKMNYMDGKVNNDGILNKMIRINEVESESYNLKFNILQGDDIFAGNLSGVLISEDYANAYNLEIGDILDVTTELGNEEYLIKGIYHSGGINNTWILKASENKFENDIYLVDAKSNNIIEEVQDCYVADINTVGTYLLSQIDSFLVSFKYITLLFVLASVIFNINMMHLSKLIDRKDHAVINVIGIGNKIISIQTFIKGVVSSIISLIMSVIIYRIVTSVIITSIVNGKVSIDNGIFGLIILFTILLTLVGNMLSGKNRFDYLEEIRE